MVCRRRERRLPKLSGGRSYEVRRTAPVRGLVKFRFRCDMVIEAGQDAALRKEQDTRGKSTASVGATARRWTPARRAAAHTRRARARCCVGPGGPRRGRTRAMEIAYVYNKKRSDFGKDCRPIFVDNAAKPLESNTGFEGSIAQDEEEEDGNVPRSPSIFTFDTVRRRPPLLSRHQHAAAAATATTAATAAATTVTHHRIARALPAPPPTTGRGATTRGPPPPPPPPLVTHRPNRCRRAR